MFHLESAFIARLVDYTIPFVPAAPFSDILNRAARFTGLLRLNLYLFGRPVILAIILFPAIILPDAFNRRADSARMSGLEPRSVPGLASGPMFFAEPQICMELFL
jgi:hypothetical protein